MVTTKPRFGESKGKNVILKIAGILLFIAQIVIVISYLNGLVNYFSEPVNVIGALNLLLDIINISAVSIFESLLKLVLGIVFIIYTVINIKNLVSSIPNFTKVTFNKKDLDPKKREDALYVLLNYVGLTVQNCFIFTMVCIMTSVDFAISDLGIFVFILGSSLYLSSCIMLGYLKCFHLECVFYRAFATLVMTVSFVLLASKLQVPTFEQLIQALTMLFGGYYGTVTTEIILSAISSFTMPILYMILQFRVMFYISEIWGLEFYLNSKSAKLSAGNIMGFVIAIVACNFTFDFILNGMQIQGVEQFLTLLKTDILILLAGITLFISFRFEKYTRLSKLAIKEETELDETGAKNDTNTIQPSTNTETVIDAENKNSLEHLALQESVITELKKYKELVNDGIISQEEFEAKKKQLLKF